MPRPLLYQRSQSGARTLLLEVDAVLRDSPSFEAQPTENPVEEGADVTDHIIRKNPSWDIEAVVTDTPSSGPAPGRSLAAWQTLQRLAESGAEVVLVTLRGEEPTAVLTRAQSTDDARTSGRLVFTASFRRIRIESTQTVPLPKRLLDKAKSGVDGGKQGAKAADAATTARSKSILLGDIVRPLGFLGGT